MSEYEAEKKWETECKVNDLLQELEELTGEYYVPEQEINGDTSDGYHTFNELYHHRAVLFSKVVLAWRDHAWKSRRHSDGEIPFGDPNWFIVGVDTPDGQATYHYEVDKYWGMFDCEEVEQAPYYDGHTPQDAIDRISKLALGERLTCVPVKEPTRIIDMMIRASCPECGRFLADDDRFCSGCGAKVVGE